MFDFLIFQCVQCLLGITCMHLPQHQTQTRFMVLQAYLSDFLIQHIMMFCLPDHQCKALLQLGPMIYQHPVHQQPFQVVTY